MPELDKKALSERDIRTKFITPAITARWDVVNQIREEVAFTNGRVSVRGKISTRGEQERADYLLSCGMGSEKPFDLGDEWREDGGVE